MVANVAAETKVTNKSIAAISTKLDEGVKVKKRFF
jgi:hypothetical protein